MNKNYQPLDAESQHIDSSDIPPSREFRIDPALPQDDNSVPIISPAKHREVLEACIEGIDAEMHTAFLCYTVLLYSEAIASFISVCFIISGSALSIIDLVKMLFCVAIMGTCILGIYAKKHIDSKKQAWVPDLFTIISAASVLFYMKNSQEIKFSLPIAIGETIVVLVTQAFASSLLKLMVVREASLHLLTLPDEELLAEMEKNSNTQTPEAIETEIKTKFRCYSSSLYIGLIASVLNFLILMANSAGTFSSIMGLLVCVIPIVAFSIAIDAKSNMSSAKQEWAARLFLLICSACLFLLVRNPEKISVPSHVSGIVMVMMFPMLYYARTLLALMKQRESQLRESRDSHDQL